jgi:hypothetical protein
MEESMRDRQRGAGAGETRTRRDDLLLNAGTRLLHIGPHKTGTTTVQAAFAAAGDRLAEHGVRYYGEMPGVRHLRAALAVTGRRALLGESQPDLTNWTRLVDEVATAGDDRVLISSEFFADADSATARRVVRALGDERVHVLVTLRPLARIVASQWQQYVQNGMRTPYEEWLEGMLCKPPYTSPTPTFWQRHRHDELIARWAAAAAPDRTTVVVADGHDPVMLLHTFEALVGLPDGFLAPEEGTRNRALTNGEVELVRLLNREFQHRDWPEDVYARFVREGAVRAMKAEHTPAPDEPPIVTPRWALDRITEIDTNAASAIVASGVRVVGDITSLGSAPRQDEAATGARQPATVSADAAARAVFGVIAAASNGGAKANGSSDRLVRDVTARELLHILLERGRRRLTRALRR